MTRCKKQNYYALCYYQALKESMSEDEWNKLSDSEKQKRIVELKMKERKLRQEGNVEEAAAIFEKVLENDECKIDFELLVKTDI